MIEKIPSAEKPSPEEKLKELESKKTNLTVEIETILIND
jgi:hypothetical protein